MSSRKRVLQSHNVTEEVPRKKCPQRTTITRGNEENVDEFDFSTLCVVCGNEKDRRNSRKLYDLSLKSRNNLIDTANEYCGTHDFKHRLKVLQDKEVTCKAGKYHQRCYLDFVHHKKLKGAPLLRNEGFPNASESSRSQCAKNPHLEVAEALLQDLKESLDNNDIFFLRDVTEKFKQKMLEKFPNDEFAKVNVVRSNVKEWVKHAGVHEIMFVSLGQGKPDIMCRKDLPLSDIVKLCTSTIYQAESDSYEYVNQNSSMHITEAACLHEAAQIIKNKIDSMPSSVQYPTPEQCSLAH